MLSMIGYGTLYFLSEIIKATSSITPIVRLDVFFFGENKTKLHKCKVDGFWKMLYQQQPYSCCIVVVGGDVACLGCVAVVTPLTPQNAGNNDSNIVKIEVLFILLFSDTKRHRSVWRVAYRLVFDDKTISKISS